MSGTTRRAVFVNAAGAIIAAAVPGRALAEAPHISAQRERTSLELLALIRRHQTAYAAFESAMNQTGGNRLDRDRADRIEEEALLAVCSYPAICSGDRRTKATYLLAVEARGELDLETHMQAVLRSMLSG
jgi:hypothetical protein